MTRSLSVLASVVAALGACTVELAPRARPPAPPSRDPHMDLSIATKTLPSGLRVVTVRDPTASEVQVTMRYGLGAVDDGPTPGIAHLVEHLMFQQEVGGQPVYTQLEDIATFFNAYTSFDSTTYVARAPQAALAKLLAIEASRLGDPCQTVSDAVFTREREVVVNELQQRDQSTEIYSALNRAAYPEGHPYRRPIGGSVDTVRAITREQACTFAQSYYAPSNAVLVISGRLATADVDAMLATIDGQIARRPGVKPARSTPPVPKAQHLEIAAPIDEDVLVVVWPLPVDPELQTKVRAIAASLPKLVDNEIKGGVVPIEIGDRGAPMLGVAVLPDESETFAQALEGTRRGVAGLPKVFEEQDDRDHLDQIVFDRIKQSAIYGVYSVLEDGSDRDSRLASYVAAGLDPREAIDHELRALTELSREEAADIASKYLASNTPTVVTLKASAGKKRGNKVKLSAPIHDLGRRRTPVDPALASQPAAATQADDAVNAVTRTLPNGLKVVLLPATAVPTVDVRLVFAAGTADEPWDQRGVATLAAKTLTWDLHYLNDVFAFIRAGGMRSADVGADRTTFSVQGVDSNLDVVLAGLRRWVRDGVYDDSVGDLITAMQRASKEVDDQGALTDAWRTSLFGANHPYVNGGLARHANPGISLSQIASYRSAYFTPDNATLVIAGRFDPKLANQWIDFLFKDWQGKAYPRQTLPTQPQTATIAKVDDTALVQVRIAIPVGAADRAQRLVAAEMLGDIARDVRFQLGASYTFDAALAETRLASFIVTAGWVDATRAQAAIQLIRDRVAELKKDSNAAARAFVVARGHVATQLRSRVGSAAALADRVEEDVGMLRDPLSDLSLARTVDALTIADMTSAINELDLGHATVLMDGPQNDINGATAALGRNPSYVAAPPPNTQTGQGPSITPGNFAYAEQHVYRAELQPALTEQPMARLMVAASASATAVSSSANSDAFFTGTTFLGEVGYRYGWTNAIGARLELGRVSADAMVNGFPQTTTIVPVNALLLWHLGGTGRGWSELLFGEHYEKVSSDSQWNHGLLYGVHAGYDVVNHREHRVGVALRFEHTLDSGTLDYSALSIGLYYRQ